MHLHCIVFALHIEQMQYPEESGAQYLTYFEWTLTHRTLYSIFSLQLNPSLVFTHIAIHKNIKINGLTELDLSKKNTCLRKKKIYMLIYIYIYI